MNPSQIQGTTEPAIYLDSAYALDYDITENAPLLLAELVENLSGIEANWSNVSHYFQTPAVDFISLIEYFINNGIPYNLYDIIFAIAHPNIGNNPQSAQLLEYKFKAGYLPLHAQQTSHLYLPDQHYNFSYIPSYTTEFYSSNEALWDTRLSHRSLKALPTLPTTSTRQHRYNPYSVERPSHSQHTLNECTSSSYAHSIMGTVNTDISGSTSVFPSVSYGHSEVLDAATIPYNPFYENNMMGTPSHMPHVTNNTAGRYDQPPAIGQVVTYDPALSIGNSGSKGKAKLTKPVFTSDSTVLLTGNSRSKDEANVKKLTSEEIKMRCHLILLNIPSTLWLAVADQFMSYKETEEISRQVEESIQVESLSAKTSASKAAYPNTATYQKMNAVLAELSYGSKRFKTLDEIIQVLENAKKNLSPARQKSLQNCIDSLVKLKKYEQCPKTPDMTASKARGSASKTVTVTQPQTALFAGAHPDCSIRLTNAMREQCIKILKDLNPNMWLIIAQQFMNKTQQKMVSAMMGRSLEKIAIEHQMNRVIRTLCMAKRCCYLSDIINILQKAQNSNCIIAQDATLKQGIENLFTLQKNEKTIQQAKQKFEKSLLPPANTATVRPSYAHT